MTEQRLRYLLTQYAGKNLTPLEQEEWNDIVLSGDRELWFREQLMEILSSQDNVVIEKHDWSSVFNEVFSMEKQPVSDRSTVPVHRVHFLKKPWLRYAAAILIIAGIGAYLWNIQQKEKPLITTNKPVPVKNDVAPGYDRATLTLSDGKKVELNDNAAETIKDGSLSIKNNNGQLIYDSERGSLSPAGGSTPGKAGREGGPVTFNTMSTPKGGTYRLTLPDGTQAWLNAASSITFPTVFIEKERTVTITGEVYFEVAKNKEKPFIVNVNGKSSIQVLGTSFNVNSYEDETAIRTTLIEGSVRITNGDKNVVLKPGQQAMITALSSAAQYKTADAITVSSTADIDQTLAWKNGLFNFNGSDLRGVMRQLQRWYDIKVQYKGTVDTGVFRGRIYRSVNLSDVLDILQEAGGVKFRLEGKTLIVFSYN